MGITSLWEDMEAKLLTPGQLLGFPWSRFDRVLPARSWEMPVERELPAKIAHFFNCLIQSNDLEGWFCGPQIHCITCRAPVTTRCFGCFLSLMTGATLKCKQFSCDLADEKVKNWGPQNVPPSFTEFETLEGAIKERCLGTPRKC